MFIVGRTVLDEFAIIHPTARKRSEEWLKVVETKNWKHIMDVKRTYQQADGGVKDLYTVFNLGNEYRVVTQIDYEITTIEIVHAFTHEEYDRWTKKK